MAREQIQRLEQKIENLEAILDIKGDYEKYVNTFYKAYENFILLCAIFNYHFASD